MTQVMRVAALEGFGHPLGLKGAAGPAPGSGYSRVKTEACGVGDFDGPGSHGERLVGSTPSFDAGDVAPRMAIALAGAQ